MSRVDLKFPEDEPLIREIHLRLKKHHLGKANAVTGPKIVEGLRRSGFLKVTEEKLRKVTNYLNTQQIETVSCGNGYFFAETVAEIDEYTESLESRRRGIQNRINGLSKRKRYLQEVSNA